MNLRDTFTNEIESSQSQIDSHMSSESDDGSSNTYAISKYFTADEAFDFDAKKFIQALRKQFQPKNMEQIFEGFSFEKDFGIYTVYYEVEFHGDGSTMLELYSNGSTDDSIDLVKNLAQYMVSEFNEFSRILKQSEN